VAIDRISKAVCWEAAGIQFFDLRLFAFRQTVFRMRPKFLLTFWEVFLVSADTLQAFLRRSGCLEENATYISWICQSSRGPGDYKTAFPIWVGRILPKLLNVAEGISYLHACPCHMLHRDIKGVSFGSPANAIKETTDVSKPNILIDGNGQARPCTVHVSPTSGSH